MGGLGRIMAALEGQESVENKRPLPEGGADFLSEEPPAKRKSKWDQAGPEGAASAPGNVLGADILADISAKAAAASSLGGPATALAKAMAAGMMAGGGAEH